MREILKRYNKLLYIKRKLPFILNCIRKVYLHIFAFIFLACMLTAVNITSNLKITENIDIQETEKQS